MTLSRKIRFACSVLTAWGVLLTGCGSKSEDAAPVGKAVTKESAEAPVTPPGRDSAPGANTSAPSGGSLANPVSPTGSGK